MYSERWKVLRGGGQEEEEGEEAGGMAGAGADERVASLRGKGAG